MKSSCILALLILLSPCAALAQHTVIVKKSSSGLCHDQQSPYFDRIRHFTAYDTLSACLQSGGHLPEIRTTRQSSSNDAYHRDAFGRWQDRDQDCLNTRQEILKQLSTATVAFTAPNSCTITHGRWFDPYTNRTFYQAHQLDIDHIVPLKWAWDHGADHWPRHKRLLFANDPVNLIAVEAGANRSKGDQSPLTWLPPNRVYRCQYVVRFLRISKNYQLQLSHKQSRQLKRLQNHLCKARNSAWALE